MITVLGVLIQSFRDMMITRTAPSLAFHQLTTVTGYLTYLVMNSHSFRRTDSDALLDCLPCRKKSSDPLTSRRQAPIPGTM